MKHTEIKISGLRNGIHKFQFELNDSFLTSFSNDFFDRPQIDVRVTLELADTLIKAELKLEGVVTLVCDRSLDPFSYPINREENHFFKFGEIEEELSEELEVISKDRVSIDFDQLVYDLVALSVPSKKLHPRFENEEVEGEGALVFSTRESETEEENQPDLRWTKLTEIKV